MKKPSKGTMAVTVAILAVGVGAAVTAAMFVSNEAEELLDFDKNKLTQPLELQGRWLGMSLASTNSASARARNIPPQTDGVVVVDIADRNGWRARQAGVQTGDVITGVDGESVRDIADLYDLSRTTDVSQAIVLDIQRWGQLMSVVLPAVAFATTPPGAAPGQAQPMPGAPVQGAPVQGAIPAAQGQAAGPLFFCPAHGQAWPQQAVHPHYRCPLCNRQLVQQIP